MGMDTEEMYRRGVADAAQGKPHPFYYEHYYQYRRGYDRARRAQGLASGLQGIRRGRRTWLIAAAVIALLGIGAFAFLRSRGGASTTAEQPTARPVLVASTSAPTRTPIFATPTAIPTAAPPSLHIGGSAQIVNIEGSVLRGRKAPSLKAAATAAFKAGDQVAIIEGPVDADGFTWWKLQSKASIGWSAQQSQDGVVWLQPIAAQS